MTSRVRSSLCSAPSTKAWTEQEAKSMVSEAVLQSFASSAVYISRSIPNNSCDWFSASVRPSV